MMDPLAVLENIHFRYRPESPEVLSEINAVFCPGEMIFLTGPSGSGKTTFAKITAGLLEPASGRVRWFPEGTGRPGLCFQFPEDQFLKEKVIDEVLIDCGDEDRLAAVFDSLELEWKDLRDRHLDRLSGGQRRMVALAGGLASDRSLLFLDEPTAGLDGEHRQALALSLERLVGEGRGMVVIGHDLRTFLPATSRVMVLDRGRFAFSGRPNDFLQTAAGENWVGWLPPVYRLVCRAVRKGARLPEGRLDIKNLASILGDIPLEEMD